MSTAVSPSAAVQTVLDALGTAKRKGAYWIARCPAHDDEHESLSISVGRDGRALLKCHAGCALEEILGPLHLRAADLFAGPPNGAGDGTGGPRVRDPDPKHRPAMVKSYDYRDAAGALVFQSCRFEPKTFRQRRPGANGVWIWNLEGVELVPYQLPEVRTAVASGRPVYIVEGEKDADSLAALGITATTNAGGAGKWRDAYSALLRGADVAILPDNDEPGQQHAEAVARSCLDAAPAACAW